jgi:hypothetical protein
MKLSGYSPSIGPVSDEVIWIFTVLAVLLVMKLSGYSRSIGPLSDKTDYLKNSCFLVIAKVAVQKMRLL